MAGTRLFLRPSGLRQAILRVIDSPRDEWLGRRSFCFAATRRCRNLAPFLWYKPRRPPIAAWRRFGKDPAAGHQRFAEYVARAMASESLLGAVKLRTSSSTLPHTGQAAGRSCD